MGLAIELRNVTKRYSGHKVLKNLNQSVERGQILVVFGSNGSGKTTLLNLIATVMMPTYGSVIVEGFDSLTQGTQVRKMIGLVTHDHLLYQNLTGLENLRYYSHLYGVPDNEDRIDLLATDLQIAKHLTSRVWTLSNGIQKRLSIVRALLHDPQVLLLDEPETGLDSDALSLTHTILSRHRERGGACVVVTHDVEYGFTLGDRIAILDGGQFSYDMDRRNLQPATFREDYLRLTGANT